ncbi:VWA domain-containing protein [Halobacteria archaeon AArc-m2/3/4]|uniref:VWA domain-containing protein n=1 Tax=Natronoglomus mannanivorans TaxID=2979990 RepID=A0ABT2QDA4_9EURY|nr:VWA domain-containing protein [Halobacteria archaeon AArc-m2/3/4]
MVEERRSPGKERRASTEIIGLVILIGMVFAGAMLVFLAGNALLDDVSGQSDGDRAELSMLEAKSELETLAFQDDAPTTLHVEDGEIVDDGEIEFRVNGTDADGTVRDCSPHTVRLGSLVGNHEGTGDVRYQAGGVWRTTDETSTMVSRPNLRYRTETVNGTAVPSVRFPIMTIEGNVGAGDQYVARQNASGMSEDEFRTELCLAGDDAFQQINRLEITIRDTSTIDAWERYAKSEFDTDNATVEGVDEGESDAVTITVNWDVSDGRIGKVGSPETTVYGGLMVTDDSTIDNPYTITDDQGNPDWITVDGNLTSQGSAAIDGHLAVAGTFESTTDDDCPDLLFADESIGADDKSCDNDGDPDIESIEPIDDAVTDAIESLEDSDDPQTGTLDAGQYYTDSALDLSGTIDTSEGDVEIGVDNGSPVTISDLEVLGSGSVRVYASGNILIERENAAHESSSLQLYGTAASDVRFGRDDSAHPTFSGLVYAPSDGASELGFHKPTEIDGAVVGGSIGTEGNPSVTVRFNESLKTDLPADPYETASATLEFLTHEVAEEVEVTEEETEVTPLDTVFVLDRSGSMDPPDNVLSHFVNVYGEQYEPVYEGVAVDSPLVGGSNDRHWTYDRSGTPRHQIYVQEGAGDDWIHVDNTDIDSSRHWDSSRQRHYIAYDIPDDMDVRVTQAGFDPAGERVAATETFIDSVLNESVGDRAGYVDFNLEGHERHSLSGDLDSVRNALTDDAGGGTDIGAGIRAGTDLYDDADTDRVMILLGDGENDVPGESTEDTNAATIEAAEEAAENNITIYTVGLGDAVDDDHLENIAETTGGEYYTAANAEELADAFERAADEVGDRTEHYIEHKDVETRIGEQTIEDDTYELSPGEPQNVTFISYDCAATNSTGDADEHDGTTYDHRECDGIDESGAHEINVNESVDTSYTVYGDGEGLIDYEGGWWQTTLSETLLDDGLIDGDDDFTLAENERVIVVTYEGEETPTGYAVFKLTMDPPTLQSGAPVSSPPSNTYVISVHQTQITVES